MNIQAILFDLEGTIIDTQPIWRDTDTEFVRRHGGVYDYTVTEHKLLGRSLTEGIRVMQEQYGFTGDVEAQAAEQRLIFQELLQREVTFIPGFIEFYESIRHRYATAIATGLERPFLAHLEPRLHLADLFGSHIYSIAEVDHVGKPDPAIFLHTAHQLGVDPEHCLVIEDASNGVEAAHRAGMRCVALTTTLDRAHLKDADQIVDAYQEIRL